MVVVLLLLVDLELSIKVMQVGLLCLEILLTLEVAAEVVEQEQLDKMLLHQTLEMVEIV